VVDAADVGWRMADGGWQKYYSIGLGLFTGTASAPAAAPAAGLAAAAAAAAAAAFYRS